MVSERRGRSLHGIVGRLDSENSVIAELHLDTEVLMIRTDLIE